MDINAGRNRDMSGERGRANFESLFEAVISNEDTELPGLFAEQEKDDDKQKAMSKREEADRNYQLRQMGEMWRAQVDREPKVSGPQDVEGYQALLDYWQEQRSRTPMGALDRGWWKKKRDAAAAGLAKASGLGD